MGQSFASLVPTVAAAESAIGEKASVGENLKPEQQAEVRKDPKRAKEQAEGPKEKARLRSTFDRELARVGSFRTSACSPASVGEEERRPGARTRASSGSKASARVCALPFLESVCAHTTFSRERLRPASSGPKGPEARQRASSGSEGERASARSVFSLGSKQAPGRNDPERASALYVFSLALSRLRLLSSLGFFALLLAPAF
ncbi:hypothetical protein SAY86_026964 [Trapa natans]|uniref:Uncharacterized protein n=1 Tax=Trapa natans TaxID=22666 RepID=A0AAN7QIK2_TRANT|nr:hypothetical protein SAY86_026964 [Trapa natans]